MTGGGGFDVVGDGAAGGTTLEIGFVRGPEGGPGAAAEVDVVDAPWMTCRRLG